MIEREGSGQRPGEKHRLNEGPLPQDEEGRGRRKEGSVRGRLVAWGCSVLVGWGGACLRTECMAGLAFANKRLVEKILVGYVISSYFSWLGIGAAFFFEPI